MREHGTGAGPLLRKTMRPLCAALAVAGIYGVAVTGAADDTRGRGTAGALPAGSALSDAPGRELADERTAHSRTYLRPDGSFAAQVSALPINYRDGAGSWRQIDNELREIADGDLVNGANALRVRLPGTADGGVELNDGAARLRFSLRGAAAGAEADGAAADYDDVFGQVDARYEVRGDRVDETLLLAGREAPRRFLYDVEAPGLRASMTRGGKVAFADADGRRAFTFERPALADAAGAVSSAAGWELVRQVDGQATIALSADARWLGASQRSFPVALTPTVSAAASYENPTKVCQVPNTIVSSGDFSCERSEVAVGSWGGQRFRTFAQLDAAAIMPRGSLVTESTLEFLWRGVPAGATSDVAAIDAHGLTRAVTTAGWGGGPSWTPWPELQAATDPNAISRYAYDGRSAFGNLPLPHLMQAWLDGGPVGVVLTAGDETQEGVSRISDLSFWIGYRARSGLDSAVFGYDDRELSARSSAGVNLGNGNLTVTADDFGLDGFDDQLTVDRSYNSLDDLTEPTIFGPGWRGDLGSVSLRRNDWEGSYLFNGPTGLDGLFVRRLDGSFAPPAGWDATLTENTAAGTVSVFFRDTEEQWDFADTGGPSLRFVRRFYPSEAGAQATYDTASGRLATLADPDGNTATFGWAGAAMTTVTDQFGDVRRYGHDGAGRLTSFTNARGEATAYGYDGAGRMTSVVLPDRSGMTVTYQSDGRVATLTPVAAGGSAGATTTYTYGTAATTVATPGQPSTVHHFDARLFNHLSETGATPPAVTLGGALAAAAGTRLPVGETALDVSVSDPDGIARVEAYVEGEAEGIEGSAPLCAAACGTSFSGSWTLDTLAYWPGQRAVRVVATDGAGNRTERGIVVVVPDADDGSFADPGSEPDPDAGTPRTTAPCESYFGAGSEVCSMDDNEDPTVPEPAALLAPAPQSLGDVLAAADGSGIGYGLAQDWEGYERDHPENYWRSDWRWPSNENVVALAPRELRRIVAFNIADTRSEGPLQPGTRAEIEAQLKHLDEFRSFAAQYDLIQRTRYTKAGGRPFKPRLIVSFGAAICGGDPGADRRADCFAETGEDSFPERSWYKRSLLNFFTAFPNVNVVSAWNEPNHTKFSPLRSINARGVRGPPGFKGGAAGAANVTLWATEACRRWDDDTRGAAKCTVLAAELAQSGPGSNPVWLRYLRQYREQIRHLGRSRIDPKIWAFHPYADVRYDTNAEKAAALKTRAFRGARTFVTGTKQLARAITGSDKQFWFTEVGSRVDRLDRTDRDPPLDRRRNTLETQQDEVAYLYNRLAPRASSRVKKILYYAPFAQRMHNEDEVGDKWDSALVGNWRTESQTTGGYPYGGIDGHARPAFCTVLSKLNPDLSDRNENKPELCHAR